MATISPEKIDGRVQRSERSRAAIIDAMHELIDSGILAPTAEKVAARAGVGIRTVFRHFSDMETLFAAMTELFNEQAAPFFEATPPEGTLAVRLNALIVRRAKFFERIASREQASKLVRWRSPVLRDNHRRWTRTLRKNMLLWLPETAGLDPETLDSLEATLCFAYWEQLRCEQGMSSKRTVAAIERTASALIAEL